MQKAYILLVFVLLAGSPTVFSAAICGNYATQCKFILQWIYLIITKLIDKYIYTLYLINSRLWDDVISKMCWWEDESLVTENFTSLLVWLRGWGRRFVPVRLIDSILIFESNLKYFLFRSFSTKTSTHIHVRIR